MISLYESILKTNNASIENDLKDWVKFKLSFNDLPMYCEKNGDGLDVIIDSFEHQPQITGINLKEAPPKYLHGVYYMKYNSRNDKGVKTPLELRFANARLDKLDLTDWHFEQPNRDLWSRNIFQFFSGNIKELCGLPSTNKIEPTTYKISLSVIGSMHDIKCPIATLDMYDGNSINPFNITKCEFKRLIISDFQLGAGLAHMLQEKTFGVSTFDEEEYIRHGNIYELNKYYQKVVEHLMTRNKIEALQVWANPSKDKAGFYWIFKNPKYGYCLKR